MNIKKLLAILAVCFPILANAQSAPQMIRFSQTEPLGTARSMAIGNATTALGGDFGALSINPAGSALFRHSEFQFTPNINIGSSTSSYLNEYGDEDFARFGFGSVGYLFARPNLNSGRLCGFSFAFGYNKLNDYTLRQSAHGQAANSYLSPISARIGGIDPEELEDKGYGSNPYSLSSAPWSAILAWNALLLDVIPDSNNQYIAATEGLIGNEISIPGTLNQNFVREEHGCSGDYFTNIGFNFDNRLFVGLNLNLRVMNFYYNERYTEGPIEADRGKFESELIDFTHIYNSKTYGTGFNLQAGFIYAANEAFRIGASISTPTWCSMKDKWYENMYANFATSSQEQYSPDGEYDYKLRTPWRYSLGASFILANNAFISMDYEGVDYRSMLLKENTGERGIFEGEDDLIKHGGYDGYNFKYANNFRIGGEFKIDEFALRAGYNYLQKPEELEEDSHILSCGFGYRPTIGSFYMDFGFSYKFTQTSNFQLYDNVDDMKAPVGKLDLSKYRVLATFGFRF